MERGPKSSMGERWRKIEHKIDEKVEYVMEKPSRRWAAIAAATALLHAPFWFNREIDAAKEEVADAMHDQIREVRKKSKELISKYRQDNEEMQIKRQLREAFEEERVLSLDLSDTFFVTEMLEERFADEDLEAAQHEHKRIVDFALQLKASGASQTEVLGYILKQQGTEDSHASPHLVDALRKPVQKRRADCEGRFKLITAIYEDVEPEIAKSGKLVGQVFGEYIDEEGNYHAGHIRPAIDQGSSLMILDGDSPTIEEKTADTAPIYEAHWLALSSYLAGQGNISYSELGIADTGTIIEHPSKMSDGSFLRYPSSNARFKGGDEPRVIPWEPVNGSWGASAHEKREPVADYGEISDAELAAHVKERDEQIEGPHAAEKARFMDEMHAHNIERELVDYYADGLDLSASPEVMPLDYDAVKKWAAYDVEDHEDSFDRLRAFKIRPDQQLPPGAERLFATNIPTELIVDGMPTESTVSQMKRFSSSELRKLNEIPNVLRGYEWPALQLVVSGDADWSSMHELARISGDVTLIRSFNQARDWEVFVSGANDVSAEDCRMSVEGFDAFQAKKIGFRDCLPQGTLLLPQTTEFDILYFGPEGTLPRVQSDREQLDDVVINVAFGRLPERMFSSHAFDPRAEVTVRVATISDLSLSGVTVKSLDLSSANDYFSAERHRNYQVAWEKESLEKPMFSIGANILLGATVKELEVSLLDREGWSVDPHAFDGAKIEKVKVNAKLAEKDRVKQLAFPEGTKVEYVWFPIK